MGGIARFRLLAVSVVAVVFAAVAFAFPQIAVSQTPPISANVTLTTALPVHTAINVCSNAVNIVFALNPAFGNHC